ncbi:MAG: glycosyltransferase family 4 protein [Myxococcales bacterium]|nr:glycosyltransferase family 4 protein [Myxococcales bacterium]
MRSTTPLRVLEVTHYMPPHVGGIEFVTESLVHGLRDLGHTVRWVASATPSQAGIDGDCIRVPAMNILEETIGLPYPFWAPNGVTQLYREVELADVVHIHDCLYLGSIVATCAAKATQTPIVLTQHVGEVPFGPVLDPIQRIAYQTIGKQIIQRVDHRVTCSHHVAQYFYDLGLRSSFSIIPNAVDTSRFAALSVASRTQLRRRWGIPNHQPVLLTVGRLVPKKALRTTLATLRLLRHLDPVLFVVGDGPEAHLLQHQPNVTHQPYIPAAEMADVYRCADVFILPSQGEGLPLSVQEALLSGLPAVVSDDAAFRRNLQDCPAVHFASSPENLATATIRALQHPVSGQKWAQQRWHTTRFVEEYATLLQSIVRAEARACL